MAQGPDWLYDGEVNRWFTLQQKRGIRNRQLDRMRDEFIEKVNNRSNELIIKLSTGQMNIQAWVTQMRGLIKDTYTVEYVFGAGGVNNMTQADWGRVNAQLKAQYAFLDRFAADIAAGKLSPAQIAARSRMYLDSATQSHERGKAAARGLRLPQYPGDGRTRCRANCKCSWLIREDESAYYCTWLLGKAEHCEDCYLLASRYNPLIIPKMQWRPA